MVSFILAFAQFSQFSKTLTARRTLSTWAIVAVTYILGYIHKLLLPTMYSTPVWNYPKTIPNWPSYFHTLRHSRCAGCDILVCKEKNHYSLPVLKLYTRNYPATTPKLPLKLPLKLPHYSRRYGTRCAGCDRLVGKEDLVRRARDKVFHIDCFRCGICHKLLDTGEQLYIVNGSRFLCKQDYLSGRPSPGLSPTGSALLGSLPTNAGDATGGPSVGGGVVGSVVVPPPPPSSMANSAGELLFFVVCIRTKYYFSYLKFFYF